jgi:hypothetical protein
MYILRVDNVHAAKEARSVEKDQGLSHQYARFVHKLAVPPSNSTQILLSTYVSSDIFSNTFSILRSVFLVLFNQIRVW